MTTDNTPATLATAKHGGCVQLGTPGSRWASTGESDPHGNRYDCERAALAMGHLTDDALANAVFLHGNEQRTMDQLLAGAIPSIAYLTAAKDRIRWLSRALARAEALSAQPSPGSQGDALLREVSAQLESLDCGACIGSDAPMEDLHGRIAAHLAARQPVEEPAGPVGLNECPITGLPFYDNMEHPEHGLIAMYGGPLDVYSIPRLDRTDDELRVERYDLDADGWVEGGEPMGYFYSEQQPDAALPAQAVDLPYSLDADPAGIRARVADVITGTLMVGAQGHTPPPAGHWAEPFWQAARADAIAQAVDLGQFLPAVRMLVVSARTSGGTAGRDAHLCEALDRVEALLPKVDSQAVGNG